MDLYSSGYEVDWQLPQDALLADDHRPSAMSRSTPPGNALASPRSEPSLAEGGAASLPVHLRPVTEPDASRTVGSLRCAQPTAA
jgi:hypothetical protein